MNNPTQPDQAQPSKYISVCHGAPVEIKRGQRIKYYCTECGNPCISRKNNTGSVSPNGNNESCVTSAESDQALVAACTIPGCTDKLKSRCLCSRHYARLRKNGDAIAPTVPTKELHGMKNTPEYRVWCSMKERCYKVGVAGYEQYGGRGITVCNKWLTSFKAFYEDLGPKPNPTYSLDRIDNNKGYSPDNCRWASRSLQNHNKRPRSSTGVSGIVTTPSGYQVAIARNGTRHYGGTYRLLEDAKDAHQKLEKKLYGDEVGTILPTQKEAR